MNDVSARANSCFLSCFAHSGKYKNNEELEQNPALVLRVGRARSGEKTKGKNEKEETI